MKPVQVASLLCFLAGIGVAVVGFVTEDGFSGNILSEAAGILVSVAITVTIVEALLSRRRAEEWSAISGQLLNGISIAAQQLALEFFFAVPATVRRGGDNPIMYSAGQLAGLVRRLGDRLENLVGRPSHTSSGMPMTLRLYDGVVPLLRDLRHGITPVVLSAGTDLELLRLLSALDGSSRDLDYSKRLVDDGHSSEDSLWLMFGDVARTLAELVDHVDKLICARRSHDTRLAAAGHPVYEWPYLALGVEINRLRL